MSLVGLIPEPPFDPRSWSGSSAHFFRSLQRHNLLEAACGIALSPPVELWHKVTSFGWPTARWREQYHSSVQKFTSLTRAAATEIRRYPKASGVLQIGAWFSAPAVTTLPCYSYHDGNAALWYRYYGRGLLSNSKIDRHLAWERRNYAQMQGVFVMSRWLGQSFVSDFGVPESKVHVVGAGINFQHLPVVPLRDYSVPRFLFVGRDFARKGGMHLLEAFRIARKSLPSAELTIVGPDPGPPEPGVIYAGFLSKSDPTSLKRLEALFQTANILVLPSIYEPFGISLLEGMAYGLACIAVNRCAMPEIVAHGETGLIAEPGDSQSLADAMIQLGQNPTILQAMGRQGRSRVEEHFTWDAVALKIKAVLLH